MEKGLWYIIIVQSELFLDRGVKRLLFPFSCAKHKIRTNAYKVHRKQISS